MQLQGIAQLGLLANTQLLNSAHQQQPSAQDIFASMLQMSSQPQVVPNINPFMQQTVPNVTTLMQQTVPSGNPLMQAHVSEKLPSSLFPVSRESVMPHSNRRVQRHKSLTSFDRYDGYGAENPPDESVLINAMMNSQQARVLAESSKC